MKKIGIVLILLLPLFVVAAGLYSSLAPRWYFSEAIIEPGQISFQDLNQAFQEAAPNTSGVELQKIENTDLVQIRVRDQNAQRAADKANSIASALEQKLQERAPAFPRIKLPASPGAFPAARPVVWATMLLAGVAGLFPATIGLILVILGSRNQLAIPSEAGQSA